MMVLGSRSQLFNSIFRDCLLLLLLCFLNFRSSSFHLSIFCVVVFVFDIKINDQIINLKNCTPTLNSIDPTDKQMKQRKCILYANAYTFYDSADVQQQKLFLFSLQFFISFVLFIPK